MIGGGHWGFERVGRFGDSGGLGSAGAGGGIRQRKGAMAIMAGISKYVGRAWRAFVVW